MGRRNYLVEGVSGTGKSAVYQELRKRGYDAIDGDNELAYQGDPLTDEPRDGRSQENHIWNVEKVKRHIADKYHGYFCARARETFLNSLICWMAYLCWKLMPTP